MIKDGAYKDIDVPGMGSKWGANEMGNSILFCRFTLRSPAWALTGVRLDGMCAMCVNGRVGRSMVIEWVNE